MIRIVKISIFAIVLLLPLLMTCDLIVDPPKEAGNIGFLFEFMHIQEAGSNPGKKAQIETGDPLTQVHCTIYKAGNIVWDGDFQQSGSVYTQTISLAPGSGYQAYFDCFCDTILSFYGQDGFTVSSGQNLQRTVYLYPTLPIAPTTLTASYYDSLQISLNWEDNAVNEEGYYIYRNYSVPGGGPGYVLWDSVLANIHTYIDSADLGFDAIYYYKVRAYNYSGISDSSNEVSYVFAPSAPTNLNANPISTSEIQLSWTHNSGNNDGFKIERKTGSGGIYANIGSTSWNDYDYDDSGLDEATEYFYRVFAHNDAGDSPYSNEDSATTLQNVPSAPWNLQASTISPHQINLSWNENASNEDGFVIVRKTWAWGSYAEHGTVGSNITSFQDTSDLAENTEYYYRVYAYNEAGNSDSSNEISATTSRTVPYAPTNLSATAISNWQIDLNWDDNSFNEVGFNIERSIGNNLDFNNIATADSGDTTYRDEVGLSEGTLYYYRVRAYNSAGDSVSNEDSATTFENIPSAPYSLGANAISTSQIELDWSCDAYNEDGFVLQRKQNGDGSFATIDTLPTDSYDYQDDSLQENTEYFYRLFAYNSAGNSDTSNEASATTPMSVPIAPSGLILTPTSAYTMDLVWNDNSFNELGFRIYRKEGYWGSYSKIDSVDADSESYHDSGLSEFTEYYYYVEAYNSAGSSQSYEAYDTTLQIIPIAPSGLTATTISASQIDLAWNDESYNESGFIIERKSGGGSFSSVGSVGPGLENYSDNDLDPFTEYFYRVCAFNTAGSSGYTNIDSALTYPAGIPPIPSNLQAEMLNTAQVRITWNDNSNVESGFVLERQVGLSGNFEYLDSLSANQNEFIDSLGISVGNIYSYQVYAYNIVGNSSYSNPAMVIIYGAVDSLDTPDNAIGVTIASNALYVADDDGGVIKADISDPFNVFIVAVFDTIGNASAIAVNGDYIYVANGYEGLWVLNFTNPGSPYCGSYNTSGGYSGGVALSGSDAFIADGSPGLRMVDISNPYAPALVPPGYNTPGFARGLAIQGNYAYIADSDSGLRVIDISNINAPVEIGHYDTPGLARGVSLWNNLALVADGSSGLAIIDISIPGSPTLLSQFDTNYAYGADVSGNKVYIADGNGGLKIVNISDPGSPSLIKTIPLSGSAKGVKVSGSYAYVACGETGVMVVYVGE